MVCKVVAWLLQTSEHCTGDLRAVHGRVAGEAEAALVVAGQKFLAVVEQNPEDARALGNWGNALCLRAELAQDAEVCFLKPHLLLVHPWCICSMIKISSVSRCQHRFIKSFLTDSSSCQHYGLALIQFSGCESAHSADGTGTVQVACALYEAAVAKYEAVLEMDPRNRAILRICAFALYDLGRLQPDPSSKTARQLLEVSCYQITISFQDQVQITVPACVCFSRG